MRIAALTALLALWRECAHGAVVTWGGEGSADVNAGGDVGVLPQRTSEGAWQPSETFPVCPAWGERSVELERLPADMDERIARLEAWFRANGGELNGVRVAKRSGWLGIEATRDLKVGEVVMRVPARLSLRRSVGESIPALQGVYRELDERIASGTRLDAGALLYASTNPGVLHLLMLLYYEKFGGHESLWEPWLSVMPTQFSTTAEFSEAQLRVVAQSSYLDEPHRPENLSDYFYMRALCEELATQFASDLEPAGITAWERTARCKWTAAALRTRVYGPRFSKGNRLLRRGQQEWVDMTVGDTSALFPVLDIFNAACEEAPPDTVIGEEKGVWLVEMFHIVKRAVRAGEEVFESYHNCNMQGISNLVNYGFVQGGGVRPTQSNGARVSVAPILRVHTPRPRARLLQYLRMRENVTADAFFAEEIASNPNLDSYTFVFEVRDTMPVPKQLLRVAHSIALREEEAEWVDNVGRVEGLPVCFTGRAVRIAMRLLRDHRNALIDRGVGALQQVPDLPVNERDWDPRTCESVALLASELKALYWAELYLEALWIAELTPSSEPSDAAILAYAHALSSGGPPNAHLRRAVPITFPNNSLDLC
jgi:hypothetical protein